ncbi:MAG: hypothetical protein C4294_17370 [Nitrospiraceae bacterium]
MTVEELLAEARRRGIRLWVEGDWLCYDAPRGALDSGLREALTAHKFAVIRRLEVEETHTAWVVHMRGCTEGCGQEPYYFCPEGRRLGTAYCLAWRRWSIARKREEEAAQKREEDSHRVEVVL